MKIKLKILALAACALIALCFAASCGESGEPGASPGNGGEIPAGIPESGEPDETPTEAPFPEPEVPEKDYGGINFNVLYPAWGPWNEVNYAFPETLTGDVMNDAIINRNKKIEDRLNIKFNSIRIEGRDEIKEILPAIRRSVQAGDQAYDLAFIHPMCDLNTFAAEGLVRNWNKVPYVDLTKPYWNQSLNDTLAVKGILLFAGNDFIIPSAHTIFFNKEIHKNHSLEDPYELVKSGKWTWDKLTEMAKQVSKPNDAGEYDLNALYGFTGIMDGPMIGIMHACNQYIVRRDEDDYPHLDLMNDKLISIVDKIYDLIYNGNQTYVWNWGDPPEREMDFTRNRVLFQISSPGGAAENYRAMEVDFGILPFPKYDEAQKDYISLNTAGLMLIPMDVKDVEMAGIVTELMAAESRRMTIPIYFDVLLNSKVTRDVESEEMLDIIFNGTVYDFGYNYNGFTNVSYIVPRLMAQKSTNVASFYEANRDWTEKNMAKVYEDILKYLERDY